MIAIKNLMYTYPGGDTPAVHNLTFSIAPGEGFGFLGPSGAGKSTTQKILTRLLDGYEGSITVLGKPLQEWDQKYYNYIGVGFELPNHYLKLSAVENLRFFASFYDVPVTDPFQLLAMVGLQHDAHKRVEQFSKGMKMRLNFIRAIMHNPNIVFLDEPTSGLDPANARILKDIILRLKQEGKTIFLTTHTMSDADELCDRVAFIFNGQILALDTPEHLKRQGEEQQVVVGFDSGNGVVQKVSFPLHDIGHNDSFLAALRTHTITSIQTDTRTLEHIFIQLTGQTLL